VHLHHMENSSCLHIKGTLFKVRIIFLDKKKKEKEKKKVVITRLHLMQFIPFHAENLLTVLQFATYYH